MEITPFYDKKMVCINCNHPFTTTKIRSRFVRVVSHETDFRPVYPNSEISPVYYNVAVCSNCGFSFTDDFSPYFAPKTKETIAKQITEKWHGRSYDGERTVDEAIEAFKLAYLSAILKKEKAISIAGITLRIAWLYREKENFEEEFRFLTTARNMYINSYAEGDYAGTQMSEVRILYMIAELSYRIGDEEEAIRNFSRVIERQRFTTDPQIVKLAKDRWQDIREEKEKKSQE